jgi:arylsulfatase A-like enzyme
LLRRDHVGAYGNSWIKTPNLYALAKQSLLFTRPYPESIPTIPARRTIHTG